MNRITIFRNSKDEVVFQQERLGKQPSGNAQQRQKQIRNGWKPEWVKSGQPTEPDYMMLFNRGIDVCPALNMLPIPSEISAALNIARYAENQVTFERALIAGLKEREEREFCLNSGLVSPISFDMEEIEVRSAAQEIQHTCIDRPHLPCDNPLCDHEPPSVR